ncbi:hypothetical protein E2562_008854 [Oryza meyeriana var. granulata]|uniref:Uncharacterized protein n=1 Tax=Oryza meyeriana var. granulata TaxID=110450 RepID=A0A6G1D0W0_9ORYZ|nr:hypothetical protein E2562_008854 [Oryza meyeriana var. granulata]
MRVFGKHVFPRQVALLAAGLVFLGATTYDVHRSIKNNEQPPTKEQMAVSYTHLDVYKRQIKNNEQPPTKEQMEALQDYINSKKH